MQGFYYTFNSLLAMSVFLELGFNGCIIQFISHEYAHLSIEKGRIDDVAPRILGRLASLTRLSLKWYMFAGVLLLGGVGLAGELSSVITRRWKSSTGVGLGGACVCCPQ